MIKNWETKKLIDIATISTGKWDANHASIDGKYRFYTCAYDYSMCDTKRFSGECLILPGNGVNVGEVFFYNGDFDAYQRTYVLSDIKISPKYLHYHMLLYWKELGTKKQYGSATNFIKIGNFQDYEVAYPPLAEQQRIVAVLDEAFAKIDKAKNNAEQNLKNAKELFESYLQSVFENNSWEKKTLGEVCDTGAGGTPLKSHKDYYENGDIPWLRSGEVDQKNIIECELHITQKGLKNSSARLFPANTVLIAMYGATAGQVGILRFECSTNQAVCGILPNKNFIPEFLYYKFMAGKDALVRLAVGGAQPNISQIKIKNTLVPVISLEEQRSIVKKLDCLSAEITKLEVIYRQKINDFEELKKSVLQEMFSGKL